MYTYRQLTPEERAQVLEARRARGYPLHAPPRQLHDGGTLLISAACFEHQRIFDQPAWLTWYMHAVLDTFITANFLCLAWVFLPNHYHLLLRTEDKSGISELIRKLHSRLATGINSRQQQRGRQVWYRFCDRNIRNDNHYWTTVHYLHANPVKHGYVDRWQDWPWSSWMEFAEAFGEEWLAEMQRAYPVLDYGKGWDES